MTKVTLANVGSLIDATTAATTINSNSAAIVAAMENTLSRDGTIPNTMGATLDMNSHQIINLPAPISGSAPARLQDLSTLNGGGTVTNIPAGGTTGQVLTKVNNTDFQTVWSSASGGVSSVGLSLPADFTVTNSPVTTTGTLTGNWATTPTGTGAVVRATSPTLVAPTLGVAVATTINKLTITPPATGSTLVIADGKSLSVNNSLSLSGTDGTTQTFPSTSGAVVTSATTASGDLNGTYPSPTILGSAVTNGKIAPMAAYTLKGNATNTSANPTDISIPALTQKVSPVAGDFLLIADSASSNQLKYVTVGSVSAGGSVSSFNSLTGSVTSSVVFQKFVTIPATITVTIASPGVVTWTNHGLSINSSFQFTTTGALPTGITANTPYFIVSSGFGASAFQFSATAGGVAINTSGSQSGVHTGTPVYVPAAGMLHCMVECVGGGGAGGGVSGGASASAIGSGAGSGGYSRKYSTAAAIGASQVVTIGAGGTPGAAGANAGGSGGATSLGSICIANGGAGGQPANGGISSVGAGGAGGTVGTGDVTIQGAPGIQGYSGANTVAPSGGGGGSSYFGGGAAGQASVANAAGIAAQANSGGGGGGGCANSTVSSFAGGAGGTGLVVITEYVNL